MFAYRVFIMDFKFWSLAWWGRWATRARLGCLATSPCTKELASMRPHWLRSLQVRPSLSRASRAGRFRRCISRGRTHRV